MPEDDVGSTGPQPRRASPIVPRATYRLQLGPDLTFADVGELAPYLAALGVSHVYLSPVLQAVAGSAHGYDVVDHGALSDALGGAAGHDAMTAQLRAHGIGQVVDIVPNHMALETSQNRWWRDVLRHGPASRFAAAFDVVWRDDAGTGRPRVVLPVLTEHYGELVRDGRIRLDVDGGEVVVRVGDESLPVEPSSLAPLHRALAARLHEPAFAVVAEVLAELPAAPVDERAPVSDRECAVRGVARIVEALLEEPAARHALHSVIDGINADPLALDGFLEQQHYRLVLWRSARHELDHRRFFDVTGLVGLRMERPAVFAHTHRRLLELVRAGAVEGLRIDHIDGLRQPAGYLETLAAHAPDAWTIVEKILVPGEVLPAWPVAGTTGYDALHDIQRVLVPPDADDALAGIVAELTDDRRDFDTVALEAKHDVLRELLAPELERVVDLALGAARSTLDWRDVTRSDLHGAITEVLCAMPVYRTYLLESSGDGDRELVAEVVRRAQLAGGDGPDAPDALAFDAVRALLTAGDGASASFVTRFEQLSGALMAKGVEDTAFYRFHRLGAACEVGGDPAVLAITPHEFHAHNVAALATHPHRMVTTSTHDTKRSEDVRARLLVLAERAEEWASQVRTWFARDEERRATAALDPPTRYLLHQTMVGAHPLTRDRLHAYLVKATREAKAHTSWLDPEPVYEATIAAAVDELFDDVEHLASLEAFVAGLEPAARATTLAQVVLRSTVPGVPDLYQGNEDLCYRLVDPDNRVPVDFTAASARPWRLPDDVLDPEAKRWVTARCLAVRRALPDVFADGAYGAIDARGSLAEHVLAFARGHEVVVAVTRFPGRLASRAGGWADTSVPLGAGVWRDAIGLGEHVAGARGIRADELFARLPVALLVPAGVEVGAS